MADADHVATADDNGVLNHGAASHSDAPRRWALLCLILVSLCYAGQIAYAAMVLPDTVASHFDMQGEPDDHMTRSVHLLCMSLLGIGLPAIMIGIACQINRIPPFLVNIPHREYWLMPEHVEEARAILTGRMIWFASGMLLFFVGVHHLVIDANLSDPVRLQNGPMIALLIAALAMAGLWIIMLFRRFRIPE